MERQLAGRACQGELQHLQRGGVGIIALPGRGTREMGRGYALEKGFEVIKLFSQIPRDLELLSYMENKL